MQTQKPLVYLTKTYFRLALFKLCLISLPFFGPFVSIQQISSLCGYRRILCSMQCMASSVIVTCNKFPISFVYIRYYSETTHSQTFYTYVCHTQTLFEMNFRNIRSTFRFVVSDKWNLKWTCINCTNEHCTFGGSRLYLTFHFIHFAHQFIYNSLCMLRLPSRHRETT